jgi:tRNA 2-thiouridine synthesizing protein A
MDVEVAAVVDARGLQCPLPVIRAKKGLNGVPVGSVIQVMATDPGSMADFEAWTRSTGHELVQAEQAPDRYTFLIRRTR